MGLREDIAEARQKIVHLQGIVAGLPDWYRAVRELGKFVHHVNRLHRRFRFDAEAEFKRISDETRALLGWDDDDD